MKSFTGCHILTTLIWILLKTNVQGSGTYLLMFPEKMRPGEPFALSVNIIESITPVTVTATVENKNNVTFATNSGVYMQGVQNDLLLNIPTTIPDGKYNLKVEGSGGLTFTNTTDISVDKKRLSIYIQTDKAIYKAGETVKFRILATKADLKVLVEDIDIEIFDANGNKIKLWKKVRGTTGVYQNELVMSEQPVLGDWKIKVTIMNVEKEQSFTIAEYVLPKFEVSVDLPDFALSGDKYLTGKVQVKYTFGKPVSGKARVELKPRWPVWNSAGPKSIMKEFMIDGEASFAIPVKDLESMYERKRTNFYPQNLSPPRMMSAGSLIRPPPPPPGPVRTYSPLNGQMIMVEAVVTESLTGDAQNGSSDITFYKEKETLKFSDDDTNHFKPGMPITLHLETLDRSGKPWSGSLKPYEINVTTTYYLPPKKIPTTEPPTKQPPPPPPQPSVLDFFNEEPAPPPPPVNLAGSISPLIRPIYPMYVPDETKIESHIITVGGTGIEEIHLTNIPKETKSISIQASYGEDVRAYKSLQKVISPSGNYINLKQLSPSNKAGITSNFEVESTEIIPNFYYKVVTKGKVVDSGNISSQLTLTTTFSLPITIIMAPSARLIVYYIRADGEIVADTVKLEVEGMFENEVSIQFDKTETLPGSDITLDVVADTGSAVHILAVDQSVLLLKGGNDITVDKVESELNSYDDRVSVGWDGSYVYRYPLPFYPGGTSNSAFEAAGLKVFTDGTLPGRHFYPLILEEGIAYNNVPTSGVGFGTAAKGSVEQDMKAVKRVRSEFPESWLWENKVINAGNKVPLRSIVPDTITSWVATAFAVHPTSGLGVAPVAAKVKTFQPFFVTLSTPYSVVRGEQLILQANVFNYLNQEVEVYVSLDYSPDYENIVFFWNSREYVYSTKVTRRITVPKGQAKAAYFPIVPKTLGHIELKVTAQSRLAADSISKTLLVEPEGLPQEFNIPVTIDLKSTTNFQKTVPITFPPDVVPGSKRVTLTVVGDLLGPTIANIDKLLKMPYGCGEQNMLKFAPNIFIVKYLIATDHLTLEIKDKAEKYMLKGYQRELTYQRKDGSFSAFGERDSMGSMWLTAFVVKCFRSATDLIDIDENVIERAMTWMLDNQAPNGTFPEPGVVHHKAMQGGSAKGLSLTAYVLISFLETEGLPLEINKRVLKEKNLDRAIKALEDSIAQTSDPYQLAVVSYALALAKSTKANEAFTKLSALAIQKDGMRHWEDPTPPTPKNNYYIVPPANAINVEMTAYALLNIALKPGVSEGLEILKWLITQRNPEGGFSSTQDTVIALQAMSEIGSRVYSKNVEVIINVQGRGGSTFSKQFMIGNKPGYTDPSVLITADIPEDETSLSISATGSGLSIAEVGIFCNIDTNKFADPSFQLQTAVLNPKEQSFVVKTCVRWLLQKESNMAVLEVGIPTGFSANKESIGNVTNLKRIDDGDRKTVIYFDKITHDPTCVSVKMERVSLTARVKPVAVRIYDYYEKTNQVTVFYGIQGAASPSVCKVCGIECGCYDRPFQWWYK